MNSRVWFIVLALVGAVMILFFSLWQKVETDNYISNTILFFTMLVVALYTYETYKIREQGEKQFKEQQRQIELTRRPFLRLAWESKSHGSESRVPLGVSKTCLLLVNDGLEKMKDVRYKGWVGEQEVGLAYHPSIQPGPSTSIVYDDEKNGSVGPLLGNQDDQNEWDKNDDIFKSKSIILKGSYFDTRGKEYKFEFKKDFASQSGFIEVTGQKG